MTYLVNMNFLPLIKTLKAHDFFASTWLKSKAAINIMRNTVPISLLKKKDLKIQ